MQQHFDLKLPKEPGSSLFLQDHAGVSLSLALSELAAAQSRPLLIICEDNESVERYKRECAYFAQGHEQLPVFGLPDWETLPYDSFSPHQDIISERLNALFHLPQLEQGILIVSITSLMHRLPPQSYIAGNTMMMKVGDTLDMDSMRRQLSLAGYQSVEAVHEHGEFAVRGSILDVFPMGSNHPFRIDLFDDEIESLRTFDPETQRSHEKVGEIRLLPGKEYRLDAAGITAFRSEFQSRFDVDLRQCPVYQDVSDGLSSPGLEYYLALFYERLDSLFDFLPDNTVIAKLGDLQTAGQRFWRDIENRYNDRRHDSYRPIIEPDEIFLPVDQIHSQLKRYQQIELREHDWAVSLGAKTLPDFGASAVDLQPVKAAGDFIAEQGHRVLFCAESAGRRETLLELLKQIKLSPQPVQHWQEFASSEIACGITVAPLDAGLWLPAQRLLVISEQQLFGNRVAQRRRRRRNQSNTEFIIRSLTELHIGDAVVHIEHGVGRYRGLQTIETEGQANEFLTLEYAGEAKLYVPVAALHLISRYSGGDDNSAPLNRLGTDQWEKTRRKAAEKIRDVAAELLDIYARRQAKPGHRYKLDEDDYARFARSFPFEETADQQAAIEAVTEDMTSTRAMDRLVCGDVGFGKTEVAMRAAFIAIQNGKQVALLVPTTLLAQQHYDSFRDRFADWPVVIDLLSRFRSGKQQEATLAALKEGKIDMLIGTHKLLNAGIDYQSLGLLIIDEEHRFGVRQKEKLKALRANVDILTLTATPIPRTLNMALTDIRDLSLIVTPPAKRLSVKTFVREYQDSLISEAVSRELLRGGQVFFLHNEVKTIDQAAAHLRELVPQARIAMAHGQMAEKDLERVMADFYHKRYNILVCSTIIETGIDIPSANTIIIERADKFGLAQLHQLRGRVGRSHHQAYAYLLLPQGSKLSGDAHKRLDAIQAASTLGAGFTLASHDLEIRGAGELLGDEQSGHMQKIGFTLYTEMLEEAVDAIKSGRTPDVNLNSRDAVDVNLRIPALIPEDYLPDVHIRLIMYKRIASCKDQDELDDLQVEMIDRFGLLPAALKRLFRVTALRLRAESFGISRIDANSRTGRLEFAANTAVDPLSLVELIQQQPNRYKLGSANQFQFVHELEEADEKLAFINELLDQIRLADRKAA